MNKPFFAKILLGKYQILKSGGGAWASFRCPYQWLASMQPQNRVRTNRQRRNKQRKRSPPCWPTSYQAWFASRCSLLPAGRRGRSCDKKTFLQFDRGSGQELVERENTSQDWLSRNRLHRHDAVHCFAPVPEAARLCPRNYPLGQSQSECF